MIKCLTTTATTATAATTKANDDADEDDDDNDDDDDDDQDDYNSKMQQYPNPLREEQQREYEQVRLRSGRHMLKRQSLRDVVW